MRPGSRRLEVVVLGVWGSVHLIKAAFMVQNFARVDRSLHQTCLNATSAQIRSVTIAKTTIGLLSQRQKPDDRPVCANQDNAVCSLRGTGYPVYNLFSCTHCNSLAYNW